MAEEFGGYDPKKAKKYDRWWAQVVSVTPVMAAAWLTTSTGNRGRQAGKVLVNKDRVEKYSRMIREGRWEVNNDAVTFDDAGHLRNGHNRLSAVVDTGITIPMLVLTGVGAESYFTMDGGWKRSLAQHFAERGEKYATHLAALVNQMFIIASEGGFDNLDRFSTHTHFRPDVFQAIMFLDDNPELRVSAEMGSKHGHHLKCSPLAMGACHFMFTKIDEEDADAFFKRLYSGVGLEDDDPIRLVRERLIKEGRPWRSLGLNMEAQAALTIKAWNAFRRGDRMKQIRWEPSKEKFPRPV